MSILRNLLILFGFLLININDVSRANEISTEKPLQLIVNETLARNKQIANDLERDEEELEKDREKLEEEKAITRSPDQTDVIRLNIGGEIIDTTRQTLTSFSKGLFSILFNGRWQHKLQRDDDGIIFFDFNPIVFRHLLDQLQLSHLKTISPPFDPSLVRPFEKMIKKLQLLHLLASDKNILIINVDGQIITAQRSYLQDIFNSTSNDCIISTNHSQLFNNSDLFIDNHPNLFRRFIRFRREKKFLELKCQIKSFSINSSDPRPFYRHQLKANLKWKQYGTTIAGGNGKGDKLNQLYLPFGIYVDDQQQSIYIADYLNHRVVKWKLGENNGQIIAGGNGQRNRIDQLNHPTDVIVDQKNKSVIICDRENRRVVRWSLENQQDKQIIIENIQCYGLMMNENGDLFVSDFGKHEVKRWRNGEKEGTIVAGGNGKGDQFNKLDRPTFIFIDQQETVYVSDRDNHRVMKWMKGVKEGIVVAGGQGNGNSLKQLHYPNGLIVNEVGDVYVADYENHRIMCWSSGSKEGRVVVGGNGQGQGSNQFSYPTGLSFDVENNLYVVDFGNHRIQRFSVDKN